MNVEALLNFVAAHEAPRLQDLQTWLTQHMYLSGLYYGVMATVLARGGERSLGYFTSRLQNRRSCSSPGG